MVSLSAGTLAHLCVQPAAHWTCLNASLLRYWQLATLSPCLKLPVVDCVPSFLFQLPLFVSSTRVDGAMAAPGSQLANGTSRADMLCQKEAERSGLWGSYSALLSSKHRPLQNMTGQQYRQLPVVNIMVSPVPGPPKHTNT